MELLLRHSLPGRVPSGGEVSVSLVAGAVFSQPGEKRTALTSVALLGGAASPRVSRLAKVSGSRVHQTWAEPDTQLWDLARSPHPSQPQHPALRNGVMVPAGYCKPWRSWQPSARHRERARRIVGSPLVLLLLIQHFPPFLVPLLGVLPPGPTPPYGVLPSRPAWRPFVLM